MVVPASGPTSSATALRAGTGKAVPPPQNPSVGLASTPPEPATNSVVEMNARAHHMSSLLNHLFAECLGRERDSCARRGHADHHRPSIPNSTCPVERMRGVMKTGALDPSRACSSESLRNVATDGALEGAFARREPIGLDGAYARYHSLLYSVAYNVLQNADDAQDCVHDALIRVWAKRVTYDAQRGSLRSFFVACVRNQAISHRRATARLAKLARSICAEQLSTHELRVEDYVENRRLYEAFKSLPEEQRAPLMLSYFLGKTHAEIAAELGLPLGTAKSRISLGLRRLGKTLKARVTA